MLYRALRAAADVALHWYYSDIAVQGGERVPIRGPVIVTANHPNALVDALIVATTLRRRVLLTAKATLFEHPLLRILLRTVGVVPLRRAKDERAAAGDAPIERNTEAFRMVTEALRRNSVVLVFPEGISHDEPTLAPLKTGAARMALTAQAERVRGVQILPFGTIFEAKERPRSRVLVRVGEPIDVDAWRARAGTDSAARLTADIDAAMRHVTLNFASAERAQRAVALARALAAIVEEPPPLGEPRSLATEARIAHRIEVATDAIAAAPPELARRVDAFVARVDALTDELAAHHVSLPEVQISPLARHGAWFVARETAISALALPIALVGRVAHWIPLRLARLVALRPLAKDPSRDQPAMRTLVLGFGLVLLWYLLLAAILGRWLGLWGALLSLVAVCLAARVDFLLRDRMRRMWRRARTYLSIRRDPGFQAYALQEIRALAAEALALEGALLGQPTATVR